MPRTPPDSSPPSRGKSEPRVSGWFQAPPSRGTSGPPPFFVSCFSFFRRRSEFEKRDENYLWCFFLPWLCLAFFPGGRLRAFEPKHYTKIRFSIGRLKIRGRKYICVCVSNRTQFQTIQAANGFSRSHLCFFFLIADAESFPRVPPKKNCYLCISR